MFPSCPRHRIVTQVSHKRYNQPRLIRHFKSPNASPHPLQRCISSLLQTSRIAPFSCAPHLPATSHPRALTKAPTTPRMQEQSPLSSGFRNQFSDSAARPGRVLDNPAVHRRFYDPDESLTGRFRFEPRGARTKAKDTAKYARYRNRAVWAQALVLFNVVGIPLSQGVYLEQNYTSLHNTSLLALSLIPALQILFTLATPLFVG